MKTLIATGLIATNIFGQIINNSNTYNILYNADFNYTTTETQAHNVYGIKAPETYENSVIKIETRSFLYFYSNEYEEKQETYAYIYTKITPKISINYVDYYNNGTDYSNYFNSLTEINAIEYDFYRSMPNASLNSVMELTTLTASNYQYLEDSWNTENFDSRINYSNDVADFGNEIVYDYNIMQQATYFLARIYIRNSYDTNEEYTDIPLDASLFIYDPKSTSGNYRWSVDTSSANYEVIDVGGLLLTILAMPFAWISTAFNYTFWAGTPYALNVGHLLAGLIIAGLIIIIIKKVFK